MDLKEALIAAHGNVRQAHTLSGETCNYRTFLSRVHAAGLAELIATPGGARQPDGTRRSLTPQQIAAMQASAEPRRVLAARYGITDSAVSYWRSRKTPRVCPTCGRSLTKK